MTHSPGPWHVVGGLYVFAGDLRIADLRGWETLTGAMRLSAEDAAAVQAANAQLMAAAPDLLAVLRASVTAPIARDAAAWRSHRRSAFDRAQAVITKAIG